MSQVTGVAALFVAITLTRGVGQSSLSIVSLAMVGKWFRRRLTQAMAIYALVMSIGFMLAFPAVGAIVQASGWRVAWAGDRLAPARRPGAAGLARRSIVAGGDRARGGWRAADA